ncbi:SusC/RagA family TonB-linked outer membrane protein [Sphingobacterium pedocola]|uniref:SusC/RagA family TonB-linked outer membrane protein n=1 Tax=Sphingobacterium pedocola TaxID=2082722 RepID=A0ABR9TA58_9SPHI|nr:SusC/RagA family TonB-linked outer membrane protein [Sphingobacterium pedocola]MBE8721969.1 SusC/RagA family TonB-linked outer membrane protein [Sphingobacterium pedocola]
MNDKLRIMTLLLVFLPLYQLYGYTAVDKEWGEVLRRPISGIVSDAEGNRIADVAVFTKDTSASKAVTDDKGSFTINVADDDVLVFSKEGFEPLEIPIKSINQLNITLQRLTAVDIRKDTAVGNIEIRGMVTDSTAQKISGVSVAVKGSSSISTATDGNGMYILEVPQGSTLRFSAVGFQDTETTVQSNPVINIVLYQSTSMIEDVVVTAFGGQTRRAELVGAVTTVKPEDLKIPSSNLTTALAGRVAGMIAFQRSGEPGADNASFFVRGISTFGSNTNPLILIDNIELTATDLSYLQPDDIESFSVMKDAAATALYGARGANGVILVTTKQGQVGKINTSVRYEQSISAPTRNLEFADPITYMRLHNEAIVTREPLANLLYPPEKIDNTVLGSGSFLFPSTDWHKELLQDYALTRRANMSVSGGSQLATYYITGAYTHDSGILKTDRRNNFNNGISNDVFTLRSNVVIRPINTMEITTRFSGTFNNYNGPMYTGSQMYDLIKRSNPVLFPAYYPVDEQHRLTNHILFGNEMAPSGSYYINPYAELVKGYQERGRSNLSAQFQISQRLNFLTEGLRARALVNLLRIASHSISRYYDPFWYGLSSYNRLDDTYSIFNLNPNDGTDYLGYDSSIGVPTANLYFEGHLNYNRTFNDKHSIGGLLVYMLRNNVSLGASDVQGSLPYRNVGLSGRATYGYDDRYIAEFNFGYNGSERFHPDHQFGFFPSAGVAWNISNEPWFVGSKLNNTISMLKLRATYGIVGNDNIGSDRFLYLSNINMENTSLTQRFGIQRGYSNSGISVGRYSDPDILWEKAKKANFGAELEFTNGLKLIGEYFFEDRTDILMTRSNIPRTMGLWVTPSANVGEARAWGIDGQLSYNRSFTNSWLQLMGNFTFARNSYKTFDELHFPNEPWQSRVGYSINQRWGYLAERLFIDENEVANSPTQFGVYGAGDIKYRDVNGDGILSELDQVPIGYPTVPEIIYGFGASYGYKNFDVSVFFQGLGNESLWISYGDNSPFFANNTNSGLVGHNQLTQFIADSYWNEDTRDIYALWPRLSTSSVENNRQVSTWFMRDGSFLRLKSAEIGYKLPESISSRAGLKSARIYFNGLNLFTWSKFKLWDVEQGGNALNYPIQRVINVGINVSL